MESVKSWLSLFEPLNFVRKHVRDSTGFGFSLFPEPGVDDTLFERFGLGFLSVPSETDFSSFASSIALDLLFKVSSTVENLDDL